mgnify:FL=1
MLELKDICFTRDNKKILENVSLKLDSDKFIVITGPNGSRKIYTCKDYNGNWKTR